MLYAWGAHAKAMYEVALRRLFFAFSDHYHRQTGMLGHTIDLGS